jgi:putative ABC transport system ATP-binding protein
MKPIIKAENLSVIYDKGQPNEMKAVNDVSFEIYPEEYVVFFGPSGCGKSTLLYTIAGLEVATEGKITVGDHNPKLMTAEDLTSFYKSNVGMIFQAYHLMPNFNVKDNILLPQMFVNSEVLEREKRAKELMVSFGIDQLEKRKPNMLSGGQQQRVAIARALINNPSIILADEPVGNLDSKNVDVVLRLLADINKKQKKTIIHVTHNPRDLKYANRIFYMEDGEITRIIRNPKRPDLQEVGNATEVSEMERLAQSYPYLSDYDLRAKAMISHLLLPFGIFEQQKMERSIADYLRGNIKKEQLFDILNNPQEKGGINLYKQTAQELFNGIVKISEEMDKMKSSESIFDVPVSEKSAELRGFIVDKHLKEISFEQVERLEEVIAQRMLGKVDRAKMDEILDISIKEGGIGLNKRTAQKVSDEIELILMEYNSQIKKK